MVTPATVYDYHPAEKRLEVRKVQEIPSGYDASQYVTERLMIPRATASQGPGVGARRKDFAKDGSGKLFVYGYGAYGYAIPPASRPAA
jgi:oligopeptidase B